VKKTALLRLLLVLALAALAAPRPGQAADEGQQRFIEFPGDVDTVTYDLSTVQTIQPGRFTITSTTIDNPDVMKFELEVLGALRSYCARPRGRYPAPAHVFTLGPPDMPVKSIEVNGASAIWFYPYKKLAANTTGGLQEIPYFLFCRSETETAIQLYLEARSEIANGRRSKELYDCKRGLWGLFFFLADNDDPAKVVTGFVSKGTVGYEHYIRVCYSVTHEWYEPK
jgi:hypothetical protein